MGRTKASAVREKARENGWLDPLSSMPDEAVLEDTFGSR
jgi:hypothetical protein